MTNTELGTRALRVAVIDDHPMFRMGVVRALEDEAGIEVVGEGATADDAVALFKLHRPDISLLDLSMPGGGHSAIRSIRDIDCNALIVVLTASEQDTDMFEALKSGASGYVLKGVEAADLSEVLRNVAAGETFISTGLASRVLSEMIETSEPPCVGNLAAGSAEPDMPSLTPREEQILTLVAEGNSNKEVARLLSLREKSIKHVMTRVLKKLHARNRTEAAIRMRDWQRRAESR